MKKKKLIAIIACIIVVLAGLILSADAVFNPYWGTQNGFSTSQDGERILTKSEAKKDLDFTMRKLRNRHPAWLEKENARVDEVERNYEEIVNSLPDSLTVYELYADLSRILSPLHDGHTYVYHSSDGPLMVIDDFSYLRTYGNPLRINDVEIDDVVARFLLLDSYEVEAYEIEDFFSSYIVMESKLKLLGFDTSNGIDFTYMIDGKETTVHHDYIPYESDNSNSSGSDDAKWVYFEIDKDNNLGIFTLTTCDYNDEYKETVKQFFEAVSAAGVENVCVDLRGNGGGNSMVADEFIKYLPVDQYNFWDSNVRYGPYLKKYRNTVTTNNHKEPQFQGNVYVLTDRDTFSAAMDFTMLIMDNDLGTIVGEASSNLPDSYGDCLYYLLPNSNLNLSVSYKKWYRVDLSKSGELLIPDLECSPKDALDEVYKLIK